MLKPKPHSFPLTYSYSCFRSQELSSHPMSSVRVLHQPPLHLTHFHRNYNMSNCLFAFPLDYKLFECWDLFCLCLVHTSVSSIHIETVLKKCLLREWASEDVQPCRLFSWTLELRWLELTNSITLVHFQAMQQELSWHKFWLLSASLYETRVLRSGICKCYMVTYYKTLCLHCC